MSAPIPPVHSRPSSCSATQAYAFAKYYDAPLVRWRFPLAGKNAKSISDEEQLYDNEAGLWGYFVRGAPSMLLRNIQPTKNLANGSMG